MRTREIQKIARYVAEHEQELRSKYGHSYLLMDNTGRVIKSDSRGAKLNNYIGRKKLSPSRVIITSIDELVSRHKGDNN